MAAQGGPDPNSVTEAVAFFVGLGGVSTAAGAVGVHLTRGRSLVRRAAGTFAGIVVAVTAVRGRQGASSVLPGEAWIEEEAIFGAIGLVAVVVAASSLRHRPAVRAH